MGRILLAGTDVALLMTVSAELEALGHAVLLTMDGQETYETALILQPDMVFLTENLPVFDGYTTCQIIRSDPEFEPDLPVIFVASRDFEKRRAMEAGATDHLRANSGLYALSEMLVRHLPPRALPGPEAPLPESSGEEKPEAPGGEPPAGSDEESAT